MTYVKIAFGLAGDRTMARWMKSGSASLASAAYAAENLVNGYFVGAGHTATVLTVTVEEPTEPVFNVEELRAEIAAAQPADDGVTAA